MRYLRVKNLESHQHYKDRRPPWIKLHREVIDDYAFSCLQDASKAHLMLLWVLASQMDNRLPDDAAWLSRKIGATETIDLDALVSAGFLVACDNAAESASAPLASRKQDAMPEGEGETETERDPSPSPRVNATDDSAATDATRLGGAVGAETVARFREHVTTRKSANAARSHISEALAHLDGMRGAPVPKEQLAVALTDFVANDADPGLAHFRGYIQRARPRPALVANGNGRPGPPSRNQPAPAKSYEYTPTESEDQAKWQD